MNVRHFNFEQFSNFMQKVADSHQRYQHSVLVEIGAYLEEYSKSMIGHLQSGSYSIPSWKELAPITKVEKTAKGFVFNEEFNPLFRTGVLHDSISYSVVLNQVFIGSSDPVSIDHELGAPHRNLPQRSFLGLAMFKSKIALEKVLSDFLLYWLIQKSAVFKIEKKL
jgi:hypothetical protein